MARIPKQPLRPLTQNERTQLEALAHSRSAPADRIARAKEILAVADGNDFTHAAHMAGHSARQCVAALVARFNDEGMRAIDGHHGGGPAIEYGPKEQERILKEFARPPDREKDQTATWSLTTLQRALRRAEDGLPHVSTYVILQVLHQAGYTWQKDRTWCDTGTVERKRKEGIVKVTDPEATQKKGAIEQAYTLAEKAGIPVWCEDEAGPYQAIPQPGSSWQKEGDPAHQPHEYIRGGTAKMLTLLHPADGQVRACSVEQATNAVLHPWLQEQLIQILQDLPEPTWEQLQAKGRSWSDWGLEKEALLYGWPPLRLILIWDNLAGHYSAEMVVWCHQHGILLLYTPLGGSWLNMAESVQRILVRRALAGQHPHSAQEIMEWLDATIRGWNADPTPFEWGGKRWQRRQSFRERHAVGASRAFTRRPIRRRWRSDEQQIRQAA